MVEIRRDFDLTEEPRDAQRLGEIGVEDLEGDLAVVTQVLGEIHRAHPALPEFALDRVAVRERQAKRVGEVHRFTAEVTTR
jgi:hypothetical protein